MAKFPSVDWFKQVTEAHGADKEKLKRLGYVEAVMGVLVEDGASARGYVLDFAGYGPASVREVSDPVPAADFTLAGPLAAWRDMIENIARNGEPDLDHTLNRLTMAGTPLRLIGGDQLRQDAFFRFNQSFQAYFDASAAVPSEFPALAAV